MRWIARLSLLLLVPGAALAHPGHGGDAFLAALLHPLTGVDHLVMLLAVGVFAARGARWAAPAAVGGLLLGLVGGGLLGGAPVAGVEWAVLAGTAVAVALALVGPRAPARLGTAVVGVFALAHGFAHGAELPAQALLANALGAGLGAGILVAAGFALYSGVRRGRTVGSGSVGSGSVGGDSVGGGRPS